MSNYILGGWTQSLSERPPASFSYTMYGMITNLSGLTSGTEASPGWSPSLRTPPQITNGKTLWTYGGGLCSPDAMPSNEAQIADIVSATNNQGWQGVDFDDECNMNIDNLITTMQRLKPKQTSYTFLAGWDYNNPLVSSKGQNINAAVQKISNTGAADRFILMCYASAMWSQADIEANVAQAIDRTINDNGVSRKKVILALTPRGLNSWNLNFFLQQVLHFDIGGLFIWDYPSLSDTQLQTIQSQLNITEQTNT